jgi:hypothetical protein
MYQVPPKHFHLKKTLSGLDEVEHHIISDVDLNDNMEAVKHVDVDHVVPILKTIKHSYFHFRCKMYFPESPQKVGGTV